MRRLWPALLMAGAACGTPPADTIVVIGSWEAAPGARSVVRGATLATEDVNRMGGVNGRPLRVIVIDDRYGSLEVTELAERLTGLADSIARLPYVLAVIGHTHSIPTSVAATAYRGRKPLLVPGPLPPDIGSATEGMFGMVDQGAVARYLGRYLYDHGIERVAVLYENSPLGRAPVEHFEAAFPGVIVSSDPIFGMMPADFGVFFDFYDARAVDAVALFGAAGTGGALLKARRDRSVDWRAAGTASWLHMAADEEGRALLAGTIVGAPFGILADSADPSGVVAEYRRRHGIPPDAGALAAYDAVRAVAVAAERGGSTPAAVTERLAALTSAHPFEGITGPMFFRTDGDRGGAVPIVLVPDTASVYAAEP